MIRLLSVAAAVLLLPALSPAARAADARSAAVTVSQVPATPAALAEGVRATLREHEQELLDCYEQARAYGGEPAAQVDLSWRVRADGSTSPPRAALSEPFAGDAEAVLLDCLEERVASFTFRKTDAAAPVDVTLTFAPRDPGGPAPAPAAGSIGAEALRKVLDEHAGEIRGCYEAELARDPHLAGRVALRWVVRADGSVWDPRVDQEGTTLLDGSVQACMLSHLAAWRFPRPSGGRIAEIRHPWLLRAQRE